MFMELRPLECVWRHFRLMSVGCWGNLTIVAAGFSTRLHSVTHHNTVTFIVTTSVTIWRDGHAISLVAIRRPLTAEARIRLQAVYVGAVTDRMDLAHVILQVL